MFPENLERFVLSTLHDERSPQRRVHVSSSRLVQRHQQRRAMAGPTLRVVQLRTDRELHNCCTGAARREQTKHASAQRLSLDCFETLREGSAKPTFVDLGRSVQFVQRFNIFVKHRTRFLYSGDEHHHHCSFRLVSDVRARARGPFGSAQTQSVAPSGGTSFFSVSLLPQGDAERNCAHKRVLIYFCMRDACKYSRDTVDGRRSYSPCGLGSNFEEGRKGSREEVVQQKSGRRSGSGR